MVALLDLRHAAGDDDVAALPRNGREQHALAQLQVLEFPPEQRRAARARRELQRLDLPAEHLVKALHGAVLRVGQCADIAGDLVGDDVLRADDAAEPRLFHEIHIVRPCHLGQHLRHARPLRRKRHEQVFLVAVGQTHERVRLEDVLRVDQLAVRAVTLDNHRVRQLRGQLQALLMLALDHADMRTGALKLPREIHADAAAAEDGDILHLLQRLADAAQHLLQLRLRADHIELIARPRDKIAVRDQNLAVVLRRTDQHLGQPLAVEIAQRHAGQPVTRADAEADHVDPPARERLHAQRRREAEDARDLLRRAEVGVDDHVQPDLLLEQLRVAAVLRVAHAGNRVLCAELLRDQAADEIRLVEVRHRDDQIRRPRPGLGQHADARAVAELAHHVECAVRPAQRRRVGVHHNNVMILTGQLAGDGIAHLAVADDDNLHVCSSLSPEGPSLFFHSRIAPLNSAPIIIIVPLIYSHSSTTTIAAIAP